MHNFDFDNIYYNFKNKVWGIASRYVSGVQDKEDVFQEIFINIHKALPKFRGDSSIDTWIYRITVNTAINYLKKKKLVDNFKMLISNFRPEHEEPVKLSDGLELLKPLGKLNHRQKMVVILAEVEEKPLEEISQIMQVPIGTIKSNLYRAREILKKELKDYE